MARVKHFVNSVRNKVGHQKDCVKGWIVRLWRKFMLQWRRLFTRRHHGRPNSHQEQTRVVQFHSPTATGNEDGGGNFSNQDGVMYWPDQELSYEMENLEPVTCGVPANVMAQLPLIIWGEDESTKGSVLQCQMCAICQQDFKHGHVVRTLPCFDSFHMDCVDQWLVLSKRCPICRTGVC